MTIAVGRGKIKYYENKGFVAVCKDHEKCVRCRTANPDAKQRRAQGRPLGYLLAFLLWERDPDTPDTKAGHFSYKPSYEDRVRAREMFCDNPVFAPLFRLERERRPGEPAEPVGNI